MKRHLYILREVAEVLKALSDPTRLKILFLLDHCPLCVCVITETLGLSQPTISRHLKQMEQAGIVSSERQGTWIIYSLSSEHPKVNKIIKVVLARLREDQDLKALWDKAKQVKSHRMPGER